MVYQSQLLPCLFQGWDTGKGFEMSTIYKTGWFAIIGGAVLAALATQL